MCFGKFVAGRASADGINSGECYTSALTVLLIPYFSPLRLDLVCKAFGHFAHWNSVH